MTIEQWINIYLGFYPGKQIRILSANTSQYLGHWLKYKNCECLRAKITTHWIFLYIDNTTTI